MGVIGHQLLRRGATLIAFALAMLCASPAAAASDLDLLSADTLEIYGDVRLVAADGETSWTDGGLGKLRSGGNAGKLSVGPQLGNVSLVWQPQFTWSLSATVVGTLQGGERTEAGLSEAFLTFKPMRGSGVAFSARAGLMWPPVSLEHHGAAWQVRDSITPSAINSWIGEEVRPLAIEGTLAAEIGQHKLRATAAVMAANDTAGTLLTFRGWALHDRTTLAFRRQRLPPPPLRYQPPYTHPLIDLGDGFARRPGYYAKLSWQPPLPIRVELFRYDNRAEPEDVNSDHEWGWRTQFNHLGISADLGSGTSLKVQALSGRTRMGFELRGARFADTRYRSAFVLLSRPVGPFGLTARLDAFDTRNRGSLARSEYDETGWSGMIAGSRTWGEFTGLVELLHVASNREQRESLGLAPDQRQTQIQAVMRVHW
jgi:hypothetical protein